MQNTNPAPGPAGSKRRRVLTDTFRCCASALLSRVTCHSSRLLSLPALCQRTDSKHICLTAFFKISIWLTISHLRRCLGRGLSALRSAAAEDGCERRELDAMRAQPCGKGGSLTGENDITVKWIAQRLWTGLRMGTVVDGDLDAPPSSVILAPP
jgi:hypothetical protein